jgi:signal transduction histidine kinase
MFNLTSFGFLFLGLVAAGNLLLGAIIYFADIRSITRRYFFLLTATITVFNLLTYIAYRQHDANLGLWVIRLVMFFSVAFAMYFFLFAANFPDEKSVFNLKQLNVIYLVSVLTMLLTLSPLVFKGARIASDGTLEALVAPGMIVFATTVLFFDFGGLVFLLQKARKASKEERPQYVYLAIGFIIMLIAVILFNFVSPVIFGKTRFIPYSITFSLPFVIFTAYAILKHHLLNVKVVAAEVFTFLLAVATLLQVPFAKGLAETIFQSCIFLLVLSFGILLIKGMRTEVHQREQLEELSQELSEANEKLKVLDQAKTEFLSVASHQLRTPLTAIKGYISMLIEGDFGKLNKDQGQTLQMVYDSSIRLIKLINEMLDLSRIESGRMEFDFAATNICEIIDSVIQELSSKAREKKLNLNFDSINRSCPFIRADSSKLREVVMNLIDNAIKYTGQGGVTIQLTQTDSRLLLSIMDTGIGVDPKDQPKLFQKFFRTDAANEMTREGTGLGIYVVKKILEAHGAEIWFESPGLGKGTTFFVSLPVPEGPILPEKVKIASLEAF